MAAPDAPTPEDPQRERGSSATDAEGPVVEQVVSSLKYGIDQVADKVKGLLRSPR